MLSISLSVLAIFFYAFATIAQGLARVDKLSPNKKWFWLSGFAAVLVHAYLLHHWIDVSGGQNLTSLNMLSLALWLIALLTLLISLRKPMENLALVIFPLAIISIILALVFPAQNIINTAENPKQLIHILLAVFTFAVLSMAGLQAMVLAVQEKQMRQKQIGMSKLPPLETMESLLFGIIWFGFLLLTLLIITSFYFFSGQLGTTLLQKVVLVFIAWIIFGCLLIGRHYLGWRGRKAIYGTLIGVGLLLVIYFGSILLSGIIIQH